METIALFLTLLVGLALGALVGVLWSRSRTTFTAGMVDQAEVMQGLDRLSDQMRDLDHQRATWQGQLN
ncbi:MAG TPA: DNA recombination protein RmuC, partial [Marmoricola sp.]